MQVFGHVWCTKREIISYDFLTILISWSLEIR